MSDLLAGLANLTKQVTAGFNTYEVRNLKEKMEGFVLNFTPEETLVREATNDNPWGPTGPQMKEIVNLTFQYDGFKKVMPMLWRRLLEDPKSSWRRVYKSLTLLNYLLIHGSERVLQDAKEHIFSMRSLEHYKCVDERGRDQGINIRTRVGKIIELLSDEDKLRSERKKAKGDNKDKYQGYNADDIRMGKGGTFNRDSPKFDDFDSSYKRKDSFEEKQEEIRSKEVNSFQFPDGSLRSSNSPELGFRQEKQDDDDDGFGDFATARTTTPQIQTSGLSRAGQHIPAISPPSNSTVHVAAPPVNKTIDLLGLDSDLPTSTTNNTADFLFDANFTSTVNNGAVVPPRPPSGGVSPKAPAQPALIDDIFGSVTSAPVKNENAFIADWSAAPVVQNSQSAGFANFDAFGSLNSVSAPSTTATTPAKQPSSGMDDLFGGLNVSSGTTLTPLSSQPMAAHVPAPVSNNAAPCQKATTPSKVGNTWAGTGGLGGLIDLDNFGLKSNNVKASPSLNEIQKNQSKQGSSNDFNW